MAYKIIYVCSTVKVVLTWFGLSVICLFFGYYLLYRLYKSRKKKLKAIATKVKRESMPLLKPVPIPTGNQKTFLNKLVISIFEVRNWELTENWYYTLDDEVEIVIPKGFKFDGASIPVIFWALLSPTGLLLIPGLIHDYGYKYDQIWMVGANGEAVVYGKGKGKEYWDNLFRTVGKNVNRFPLLDFIAWLAVWKAGGSAWKGHRRANMSPTIPVLKNCGVSSMYDKGGNA